MFAEESTVDGCDSVLDGCDIQDGMADSEGAHGAASYAVECGVGFGLGSGDVVPHPDFVGACAFEAGEATACAFSKKAPKNTFMKKELFRSGFAVHFVKHSAQKVFLGTFF